MNKHVQDLWEQVVKFFKTQKLFGVRLDDLVLKIIYAVVFIFMVIWLLPSERPFEYQNLTVGSIAREEIIAPFTFPILKTESELKKERQQAWLSIPPVFRYKPDIPRKESIILGAFFDDLRHYFHKITFSDSLPIAEEQGFDSQQLDSLGQEILLKYNISLNKQEIKYAYQLFITGRLDSLEVWLQKGLAEVYSQGVIDRSKEQIPESKISIIYSSKKEETKNTTEVFDLQEASGHIYNLLKQLYPGNSIELKLAERIVPSIVKPDLIYDEELTKERKNEAVQDVPLARGYVYKNQIIVEANEIVTEDIYRKLQSLSVCGIKRKSDTAQPSAENPLYGR